MANRPRLGVAALIGLSAIASALGSSHDKPSPVSHPAKSTATSIKAAKPKPRPKPNPAARYAAEMKRLGWKRYTDSLWVKPDGRPESDDVSVTWRIRVVSPTGCPNGVYLEANILDTSNAAVDYANDFLPTLPANQQAVLTISSTADGTIHPDYTKLECH